MPAERYPSKKECLYLPVISIYPPHTVIQNVLKWGPYHQIFPPQYKKRPTYWSMLCTSQNHYQILNHILRLACLEAQPQCWTPSSNRLEVLSHVITVGRKSLSLKLYIYFPYHCLKVVWFGGLGFWFYHHIRNLQGFYFIHCVDITTYRQAAKLVRETCIHSQLMT